MKCGCHRIVHEIIESGKIEIKGWVQKKIDNKNRWE